MGLVAWLGYTAAVCTTGSYVPQVWKVWKTRQTQDLSLKMLLALMTGLGLWMTFGIVKGEWSIILANGITLALAGIIVVFKLTGD